MTEIVNGNHVLIVDQDEIGLLIDGLNRILSTGFCNEDKIESSEELIKQLRWLKEGHPMKSKS